MGNRRAREFHLEQSRLALIAEHERAMQEPRLASHRYLVGLNILRLQIIVYPSFAEPRAWEVRQKQEEWCLYRARIIEPTPDAILAGCDLIPFESKRLQEFYGQLTALTLPLGPGLDGFGGADGSLFQLAILGSGYPQCRFQWWSVPPPQWQPMVIVANDMIRGFLMVEGLTAEECADWIE